MEVMLEPKRKEAFIGETDAFCGPCFHFAMNHTPPGTRAAPMCWECPGAKSDYRAQPFGWWDRPDGDPSLEGFKCPSCQEANPLSVKKESLEAVKQAFPDLGGGP